jgi:TonB family protein
LVQDSLMDVYSPREIALAAGVSEASVLDALGTGVRYVPEIEAVRIGRSLRARAAHPAAPVIFAAVDGHHGERHTMATVAASGIVHAALFAAVMFVATLKLAPPAAAFRLEPTHEVMRLVFLNVPGPGGGGGGGGTRQPAPPPKAMREGKSRLSSPLPARVEPKPVVPAEKPPEPKPVPLKSEQLPVLVAPVVAAPANNRDRIGVLEETTAQADSRGAGRGGGAGTGSGTGLGSGDGAGVGPGIGGGTGGGPYRPGSGIQPPRLLHEVKADYTEEARRRGIRGEVVLEIVIRRDGSVGDVRVLHGLDGGLNDRAAQAVRQWRFAPAQRQGVPVDVIVEVSVEFSQR